MTCAEAVLWVVYQVRCPPRPLQAPSKRPLSTTAYPGRAQGQDIGDGEWSWKTPAGRRGSGCWAWRRDLAWEEDLNTQELESVGLRDVTPSAPTGVAPKTPFAGGASRATGDPPGPRPRVAAKENIGPGRSRDFCVSWSIKVGVVKRKLPWLWLSRLSHQTRPHRAPRSPHQHVCSREASRRHWRRPGWRHHSRCSGPRKGL